MVVGRAADEFMPAIWLAHEPGRAKPGDDYACALRKGQDAIEFHARRISEVV